MVVETDDRDERTDESEEKPPVSNTLIGWLAGAVYAEIRASRVELRETRRELSERIDRVEQRSEERDNRLEERVARIEGGIEAEREKKNRSIARLSIILGVLIGLAGLAVGVASLLN